MSEPLSFADEITTNKNAVAVPTETASIETSQSSLEVRLRGDFISECELTSPSTGERIPVLFAEGDPEKPKLTASHDMLPAGPYEGIGDQHGYVRWSDLKEFELPDGPDGERRMAVQAKRSDTGLSMSKLYSLNENSITMQTTVRSSEDKSEETSMGNHLYFPLPDEDFNGLLINGKPLDELLGEGSEDTVRNDGTLYWDFGGEAVIQFPDGHSIKLSTAFSGSTKYPTALWIWKRPGSASICFEPIVGVERLDNDDTSGVQIEPFASATLTTTIELL